MVKVKGHIMEKESQKNQKKYINAILFLCQKLGGSIVGKKKLYKLLYYIDFDNYEYKESMKSITGNTYVAWKMGPVPSDNGRIIEYMISQKLLSEKEIHLSDGLNDAKQYTALKEPDMSIFTDDERFIMKRVIKKYGQLTGKQLEILTHAEAPFIATEQNEIMDYGLTFYRETSFDDSVATA